MEKQLLQRQQVESLIYYANERQKQRKIKTNLLLAVSILGLCVVIRLESNSVPKVNESTNQQYLDIPSKQMVTSFSHSQLA